METANTREVGRKPKSVESYRNQELRAFPEGWLIV
jgi:hypothetical protein